MIKTILATCLLFASHFIFSQESVSTLGGEATGSGGTVSYTLGQVFYTSLTGSNNTTLTEGVQQPRGNTTYLFNNGWTPSDPNARAITGDAIVIVFSNATIYANTSCNTVTVNPGAGLIVDTGITLTATNGLTLESSSTSYSSLILNGSALGTINYERHVNINGSGSTGNNDLISAPLTGQDFASFAVANPNIYNNGAGLYLFGPFEKATGTFVTYSETETSILDASIGYRAATSDNGSLTFTGTAENGNVSNDIVNGGTINAKWNLIGNPYPSYINVQDFLSHDLGGLTNIQLFDASTAAIYGYDGSAQNGWTIYNLSTITDLTVIAPGQGFFISANPAHTAAYDIEFTPAMRRTGTGDDFIAGRNTELTYVKLSASTDNKTYVTDIYFNDNASLGLDVGYDAAFWGDTIPDFALYSHLVEDNSGQSIAIQSLNNTDISDITISLGVHTNQGEQLTFSISESTLPESVNLYLDDTVANTTTLLNTTDYVMSPTTALSGTGRFFLRTSEALSTIDTYLEALNIFVLNDSKELIVSGQLKENTLFELYDIQGRKVLATELDTSNIENRINTASLSTGVYVTKIFNSSQIKTKKVIIK